MKLTRKQFIAYLQQNRIPILVKHPVVSPCGCRDINCKGWRLVERRALRVGVR